MFKWWYISSNMTALLCRFAGSPQSGAQCPLLSGHKEDHGKKIHRHDIAGCLPLKCHLSYEGHLK